MLLHLGLGVVATKLASQKRLKAHRHEVLSFASLRSNKISFTKKIERRRESFLEFGMVM